MPKLLTTPFANDAPSDLRTDIQESTGAAPNSATYQQGFPEVTMRPLSSDGIPPKGSDFNGVLYDITGNIVFLTQGNNYGFDAAYATKIGGYPLNSRLVLTTGEIVQSTVPNNTVNPNVSMTGWVKTNATAQIIDSSGMNQQEINDSVSTQLETVQTDLLAKADTEYVNEQLLGKIDASLAISLIEPKADTTYVNAAISGLSSQATKFYPTLAEANADIATLQVNQPVQIGEIANGGLWYKATSGATSLTKSPYDPLNLSKDYTNARADKIEDFLDDNLIQLGSTNVAHVFASDDDKDLGHINSDGSFLLCGENESLQDQLKSRPKVVGDKVVAYSFDDSNNQSLFMLGDDGNLYLAADDRSIQDQIFAARSDGRIAIINNPALTLLSKSNADTPWLKKNTRISSSRSTTPTASNRIPSVVKIPTGVLILYSERISPYDGDNQGARLMQRFVTMDSDYTVTAISAAIEVARPSVDTGLTKHPMTCRAANGNLVLVYDERETTTTNYRQYVRTSSDNGVTWSSAVEIPQNSAAAGQVCAVGSTGAMVVLSTGRIICPMYTTNAIWMMYSDDNGATWTHGAMASGTIDGVSYLIAEPSITIDKLGNIISSVRSQKSGFYKKLLYKSTDYGLTTVFYRIADELISASCASSIFYDPENDLMLHSTPANAGAARTKYRLQYSTDNGAAFIGAYRPFSETYYVGYSQIIKIATNTYLVVFEGDEYFQLINGYENIATLVVNTSEILNHVNYS